MKKESLGIRNNNPCNIRTGSNWIGLDTTYKGEFCRFRNVVWGIRAVIYLIRKYHYKYGLKTVEEIINRWAPPQDNNNTSAYIEYVKTTMQAKFKPLHDKCPYKSCFDLDTRCFDINDTCRNNVLYTLIYAMCKIESGYILTKDVFDNAMKLL